MATTTESQLTTPTRTIEAANGVRYAYRRFGDVESGALPLVLLQHYRGNLDNWDPALVDALGESREVIIFDNAGVAGSTGTTPRTMTAMAHDALRFIDALGLDEIDLLGYSIGGVIAPELPLPPPPPGRPPLLAGTRPPGRGATHGY